MKTRRTLTFMLALAMLISLAAGCSITGSAATSATTAAAAGTTQVTTGAASAVINYQLGATPDSLDPQFNSSSDGACVIQHCFEGLTTKNEKNQIVPGMAESWTTSADGLVWTFKLRSAKWSDGVPVKAADFVFAWQRACDPEVAYSYQMSYIKNADEITMGTIADKSQLAVRAIDDKTLEVTLIAPCSYFTQLTAFPTFFPVREDVVKDGWANDPATYVCNGPYIMTACIPQSEIVLEQNKNYYNAAALTGTGLSFKLTDDDAAALAAFESGEIDIVEFFPPTETQRMKDAGFYNVKPIVSTYFYAVNQNSGEAILKDAKFRKALALAVNRDQMIQAAELDSLPAYAYVPQGMIEPDGTDFRTKGGNFFGSGDYAQDVAEARALLKDLGHENGKGIPTLTLLYNNSETQQVLAESVQNMWQEGLGIKVKLESQEWQVFMETRNTGDYQIAIGIWDGDYNDPMTFLDMWQSDSGMNITQWQNTEYDRLIKTAQTTADETGRMQAMHEAEKILMAELPILPVYYTANSWLDNGKVKNYVHDNLLGQMNFIWATKTE